MSVGESQSLGETLRRQGIYLLEARVGRTAVIDRIFAKNGYGDVLPILRYDRHNLIFLSGTIEYVFPWPDIAHVEYPAEQENGVQVPALPAL